MRVEYSSNNSGGGWWLKDRDWRALEAAGWKVKWVAEDTTSLIGSPDGRWLGALATHAERKGLHLSEAIEEWERVVGQSSDAPGCSCCGQPHHFTEYNDAGEWVASGPDVYYDDDEEDE